MGLYYGYGAKCTETHSGETYPVKRASDNVGLRMGTGVIYYEELADDMSETWDVFDSIFRDKLRIRAYPSTEPFRHPVQSIHFDPDLPYDYPISSMHPDGGFLHPSPPPEPYYSPPSDPPFQQFHPRSCLRPLWRRRCLIIPLYTFPRGWMAMATFRMILR
ncbi:hypothetical protein PIB30_107327 [Stylosanthes scabra]|uniref:Uncharacterized protein n=1 Tax=Stylosanthes scabra TaxID=79078 RepID=A0ABU6RZP0_9FABA|nr:hypothetical protein [Stylosanthes scabra]